MYIPDKVYKMFVENMNSCLTSILGESEFNDIFVYFEKFNKLNRVIPRGLFGNFKVMGRLQSTPQGVLFENYLSKMTNNLRDDVSKSRKFSRMLNSYHKTYGDILPYTMVSYPVFTPIINSVVASPLDDDFFSYVPMDEGVTPSNVRVLSIYLTLLFHLQTVDVESDEFVGYLNVFISQSKDEWISGLLRVALSHMDK